MSKKKLPKLYQYEACPFCWKIKAILAYKNVAYETVEVHPLNKKEIAFSKDYRKVPIFLDKDDTQVNDSNEIMRYIEKIYRAKPLFETQISKVEEENAWLEWSGEVLARSLPPLIYQSFWESVEAFDYITKVGKFSWFQRRIIKYSGAFVMTMVAKKLAKKQSIADPKEHFMSCLLKLSSNLKDKDFLGADKLNGADLAVYGVLRSVEILPAFSCLDEYPLVKTWYYAVKEQLVPSLPKVDVA